MPNQNGISPEFLKTYGETLKEFGTPEEQGLASRALEYTLGAPFKALEGMGRAGLNLMGSAQPTPVAPLEELGPTPAESTSGKVVDFLGNLAPFILQSMAITPIARSAIGAAGISSPLLAHTSAEAINFGALGLQEDREMGLEQAAEGAAYGALAGLPMKYRVLPAALVAGGSKAYFDYRHPDQKIGDYTVGDISAAAGFLTSFLPRQIPTRAAIPDHFATGANSELPPGIQQDKTIVRTVEPDGPRRRIPGFDEELARQVPPREPRGPIEFSEEPLMPPDLPMRWTAPEDVQPERTNVRIIEPDPRPEIIPSPSVPVRGPIEFS